MNLLFIFFLILGTQTGRKVFHSNSVSIWWEWKSIHSAYSVTAIEVYESFFLSFSLLAWIGMLLLLGEISGRSGCSMVKRAERSGSRETQSWATNEEISISLSLSPSTISYSWLQRPTQRSLSLSLSLVLSPSSRYSWVRYLAPKQEEREEKKLSTCDDCEGKKISLLFRTSPPLIIDKE